MNVEKLVNRWYTPDQYSSDDLLRTMIYEAVEAGSRVLDVGAGVGDTFPYSLKERVEEVVGVDVDRRVESNPNLHRAFVCDIASIPVEDNYFDVVISRYVLEHISEPGQFLKEMNRVLKPGGRFVFLTPNKWHYVSVAARFTPHWFHDWYNSSMRGFTHKDAFPTKYFLNTATSLNHQLSTAGFEEDVLIQRETMPHYLMWSYPSFYLGLIYERLVSSTKLLRRFRVHLLGRYTKRR